MDPDPITGNLRDIDQQVSPAEIALSVPVDSSQMAAVIETGKRTFVYLYGPPETGKSQTITNLIANALYGKCVPLLPRLRLSVESRLAKIGLDSFCLDAFNKPTKRHVLQQLEKALQVTHIQSPRIWKHSGDKIFEERKVLIAYMNALHEKRAKRWIVSL